MKKDKEWLKKQFKNDENNALNKITSRFGYLDTNSVNNIINKIIDQLDKPEIPVVPQFVADYIQIYKKDGLNLLGLLDNIKKHKKISDWCVQIDGSYSFRTIAKAWLDGYTIEQPKLLTVIVKDYDKTIMSKQLPEDEVNKMMEGLE